MTMEWKAVTVSDSLWEGLASIYRNYGREHQLWKMGEEAGELRDAIDGYCDGKPSSRDHLVEEMADVAVMLAQVAIGMDVGDELQSCMAYKVQRQLSRMKDGEE